MKPNYYLDLKVKNTELNIPFAEGIPPALVLITGKIVNIFHAFNKQKNENKIALSLPEYSKEKYRKIGYCFRFFVEERDLLDDLVEYFENNSFIEKHFDIRGVKKVNKEKIIKYSAFISKKIPRRLQEINGLYNGLSTENYIDRCEYLHALPNFRLKSTTNGNTFTLFIDIKNTSYMEDKDGKLKNDKGYLNSYGFSTNKKPIYLPDFKRD